jgi:hypothetical protein
MKKKTDSSIEDDEYSFNEKKEKPGRLFQECDD